MAAVGCDFVTLGAHGADPIDLYQTPYTTFADIEPDLLKLLGHPRATIGGVIQGKMLPDMRQSLKVDALAQAHRPYFPRPIATRRALQNLAQSFDGPVVAVLTDKCEPHIFWLAKNCVAFLGFPSPPEERGFPGEGARSPEPDPSAVQALAVRSSDTAKSSAPMSICKSPDPPPRGSVPLLMRA